MLERECPCKARAEMLNAEDEDGLMRRDRVRMDLTTLGEGVADDAVVASMFGGARVSGVETGYLIPNDGLIQRRPAGLARGVHSRAHVGGLVDDVGTLLLWGLAAIGAYFVVKGKFRITAQTRR